MYDYFLSLCKKKEEAYNWNNQLELLESIIIIYCIADILLRNIHAVLQSVYRILHIFLEADF